MKITPKEITVREVAEGYIDKTIYRVVIILVFWYNIIKAVTKIRQTFILCDDEKIRKRVFYMKNKSRLLKLCVSCFSLAFALAFLSLPALARNMTDSLPPDYQTPSLDENLFSYWDEIPADIPADIPIYIDGHLIPEELYGVEPMIIDDNVYLPIRFFAEFFLCRVEWQDSRVIISSGSELTTEEAFDNFFGDRWVVECHMEGRSERNWVLTLGNYNNFKPDEGVTIGFTPFIKDNRLMVPMRFISEVFNCEAVFRNGVIDVSISPTIIDGKRAVTLVDEYSTAEYMASTITVSNTVISAFFGAFEKELGAEVAKPSDIGNNRMFMDGRDGQYFPLQALHSNSLLLLDAEGEVIKEVIFYQQYLWPDNDEYLDMENRRCLFYDKTEDRWYEIDRETVYSVLGVFKHYNKYGLFRAFINSRDDRGWRLQDAIKYR